ncbi:MAG: hypothetical protein M0D57_09515 [Sphingobacteriales bacterium JAD_PAG50586_3]|nr:MAG: hypothetical protein M0D57_09515 [Sphingobacteriales bacterium JAD_PAG50586_3]
MKHLVCVALAALTFTTVNAQIGGGLLNKAKNAVTKDKKDKADEPAKTSSGGSSSDKGNDAAPVKDYKKVNNDLIKVIGDEDLYYSSLIIQGKESKYIVPKIQNSSSYMEDQFVPKLVNFHDKEGKIFYCYFAIYESMAKPLASFSVTSDNWDRYTYQKWDWDKSSYTTSGNLQYNAWGSSTKHKGFTGIIKQADGSIITYVVPKFPDAADKEYNDYVSYVSLGYNPKAAEFDLNNTEVEILTRTEAGAKTADFATAKTMAIDLTKKILDEMDAKSKADADAKTNANTRSTKGMTNAAYEKTMLTYLTANFKSQFRKPEYWQDATIGGLIITSTDWNISKNKYGLILNRYISCEVVIKNKGKCYVKSFQFAQDYSGGGVYSTNLYYNGFSSDLELIKCEKAK